MRVFYVDGESRGNEQKNLPRNARIVIAYADSRDTMDPGKFKIYWQLVGDKTNNEAEYQALLKALALIEEWWAERETGEVTGDTGEILIRSDSKLIVNQVRGEWQVEDSKLVELCSKARDSIGRLGSVRMEWVPREKNFAGLWLEGKLKPFSVEKIRG